MARAGRDGGRRRARATQRTATESMPGSTRVWRCRRAASVTALLDAATRIRFVWPEECSEKARRLVAHAVLTGSSPRVAHALCALAGSNLKTRLNSAHPSLSAFPILTQQMSGVDLAQGHECGQLRKPSRPPPEIARPMERGVRGAQRSTGAGLSAIGPRLGRVPKLIEPDGLPSRRRALHYQLSRSITSVIHSHSSSVNSTKLNSLDPRVFAARARPGPARLAPRPVRTLCLPPGRLAGRRFDGPPRARHAARMVRSQAARRPCARARHQPVPAHLGTLEGPHWGCLALGR